MSEDRAFVIMQVGGKASPDRKRADDVYSYVVTPALREVSLQPYRSDLDPTPGQINQQMLRRLLEARVVIADLTGRNPNVFYEFGIVHAFARPVIALADSARSLPFDAHDERVIELGEHGDELGVRQAEEGKAALCQALEVVLASGYVPASPLTEIAARRSLDELAPQNPIAAELAAIRESLAALRAEIAQERRLWAVDAVDAVSRAVTPARLRRVSLVGPEEVELLDLLERRELELGDIERETMMRLLRRHLRPAPASSSEERTSETITDNNATDPEGKR